MKVAIIGATGFVGRHLCDICIARGDSVSILVRRLEAVESLSRDVSVLVGGLGDEEIMRQVCADAEVVFNAAGALGKWQTRSDELEYVNTRAAGQVVRCAAKADARKVMHISTAGVTGPLPARVCAAEDYPCNPTTEYQRTKLAGEEAALDAHRETGIPLVIARPAFVYGPGDTHKLSLFQAVASGRLVLVDGGRSQLHPVFIEDLVAGLLLASERAPGNGEIYILASDLPVTTRVLIETIAGELGVHPPKFSLPSGLLLSMASMAEALGRAVGKEPPLTRSRVNLFSENYAYNISKARRELGYAPSTPLAEGVRRTIEWYTDNNLLQTKERVLSHAH